MPRHVSPFEQTNAKFFLRSTFLEQVLGRFHSSLGQAIALWVVGGRCVVSDAPLVAKLVEFAAELWAAVRFYAAGNAKFVKPVLQGRCDALCYERT